MHDILYFLDTATSINSTFELQLSLFSSFFVQASGKLPIKMTFSFGLNVMDDCLFSGREMRFERNSWNKVVSKSSFVAFVIKYNGEIYIYIGWKKNIVIWNRENYLCEFSKLKYKEIKYLLTMIWINMFYILYFIFYNILQLLIIIILLKIDSYNCYN